MAGRVESRGPDETFLVRHVWRETVVPKDGAAVLNADVVILRLTLLCSNLQ